MISDSVIEDAFMGNRNAAFEQFREWRASDVLTTDQLSTWLLEFWGAAEWPRGIAAACGFDDAAIVAMFRAAGFVSDDPEAAPPIEPMRLYRGCTEWGVAGFSWTRSPEIARWFAKREELLNRDPDEYGDPVIVAAMIEPAHVLGIVTGGRNEAEVIIDPIGAARAIHEAVRLFDLDAPDIPTAIDQILGCREAIRERRDYDGRYGGIG